MNCQHEGCEREGIPCFPPEADKPLESEYFCDQHARQHGYCRCCGEFWGGIASFDVSNGLCEHCEAELADDDEGEDDDYDDDYWCRDRHDY